MKLNKVDWKMFYDVVQTCKGGVYLNSIYGDRYNLKSELSAYVAIAEIVHNHNEELELFCDLPEDEMRFMNFFNEHPEIL